MDIEGLREAAYGADSMYVWGYGLVTSWQSLCYEGLLSVAGLDETSPMPELLIFRI